MDAGSVLINEQSDMILHIDTPKCELDTYNEVNPKLHANMLNGQKMKLLCFGFVRLHYQQRKPSININITDIAKCICNFIQHTNCNISVYNRSKKHVSRQTQMIIFKNSLFVGRSLCISIKQWEYFRQQSHYWLQIGLICIDKQNQTRLPENKNLSETFENVFQTVNLKHCGDFSHFTKIFDKKNQTIQNIHTYCLSFCYNYTDGQFHFENAFCKSGKYNYVQLYTTRKRDKGVNIDKNDSIHICTKKSKKDNNYFVYFCKNGNKKEVFGSSATNSQFRKGKIALDFEKYLYYTGISTVQLDGDENVSVLDLVVHCK